jgi:hypothetical protein
VLFLGERALRVNPIEKRSVGAVLYGKPAANSDAATCFHPNHPINTDDPSNDNNANVYTQAAYSARWRVPPNCNAHVATSNHPGGAQFALGDGKVTFLSENVSSNPIAYNNGSPASGCTSTGSSNVTGPGAVYQNLYWIADGNPTGSY